MKKNTFLFFLERHIFASREGTDLLPREPHLSEKEKIMGKRIMLPALIFSSSFFVKKFVETY
jgi:hypothetical protein